MKTYLFGLSILLLLGCNSVPVDDVVSIFPQVKMESVTTIDNENFEIAIELVDPGSEPVERIGYVFQKDTFPTIDAQRFPTYWSSSIRPDVYTEEKSNNELGLAYGETYYFRAYAESSVGEVLSEPLEYTVPPPSNVSPPCSTSLTENQVVILGTPYEVGNVEVTNPDLFEIEVFPTDPQAPSLRLRFNALPLRGVFKTAFMNDLASSNRFVNVQLRDIGSERETVSLYRSQFVYVEEEAGLYTISFCRLDYKKLNDSYLVGSFSFRL